MSFRGASEVEGRMEMEIEKQRSPAEVHRGRLLALPLLRVLTAVQGWESCLCWSQIHGRYLEVPQPEDTGGGLVRGPGRREPHTQKALQDGARVALPLAAFQMNVN